MQNPHDQNLFAEPRNATSQYNYSELSKRQIQSYTRGGNNRENRHSHSNR